MLTASMSSSSLPSVQLIQSQNQLSSLINEIKKFRNYSKQLNLLLDETLNAYKELKSMQSKTIIADSNDLLPLSEEQITSIKSLRSKRLCIVICGQNVLAKSLVTNELLNRQLLPFQLDNLMNEKWRIIKIKYGKNPNYSFQLIDSDFELMNVNQSTQAAAAAYNGVLIAKNLNTPSSTTSSAATTQTAASIQSQASSYFHIPIDDLRLHDDEDKDNAATTATDNLNTSFSSSVNQNAENQAIIEITIDCKLLEYDCDLIVYSNTMQKSIFENLSQNIIPIYLYAIIDNQLTQQDVDELNNLKSVFNKNSVFFVKIPTVENYKYLNPSSSTTSLLTAQTPTTIEYNKFLESIQQNKQTNINMLKYLQQQSVNQSNQLINNNLAIFKHLCDLNFLNIRPTPTAPAAPVINNGNHAVDTASVQPVVVTTATNEFDSVLSLIEKQYFENEFCEKWHLFFYYFSIYIKRQFRYLCIQATTILYKFHEKCLNNFINFAYDMARDMLVTPRKIEYAREKEQVLFDSLNSLASMKQEELKNLINNAIDINRESILNAARQYQFADVELIDDNENEIENSTASSSVSSLNGDLLSARRNSITVKYVKDFKKCTQQIQELVITKLNNAIAQQITDSVEVLKENYIGTLKRCLQSLEDMNGSLTSSNCSADSLQNESSSSNKSNISIDSSSASEALKQILHSAYQVEVTLTGSSNIVRALIERMKELLRNMPWNTAPKLDDEWKVSVASNMLNSLSESNYQRLARILCNQMKERLKSSHYLFTTSLKMLETKHNGRLEKTEENQAIIRKVLAPKFAKLCLESTSLKDLILYGMPQLGKEIGRGQYGVVYQCAKWAKYTQVAIKSVVPPDEKHWNDLALEFHYTKQITDHERIVKLIGSVIDYSYGGGLSPAVLLIMEGMKRDLYTALKVGLDWLVRLQISLDVVEGIRYLHGRGLVHRDIKLKNVLLNNNNRAKITDLGFCKPEAMMSGSVVGTPVHMAPEVFNSKYDNTVDIYAFGILFWYICAGHVRLPQSFEQCTSKDDLWSAVKRGKRPERLSSFDDDCWRLMECCWAHDPKERPHIGEVYTYLNKIFLKYRC